MCLVIKITLSSSYFLLQLNDSAILQINSYYCLYNGVKTLAFRRNL